MASQSSNRSGSWETRRETHAHKTTRDKGAKLLDDAQRTVRATSRQNLGRLLPERAYSRKITIQRLHTQLAKMAQMMALWNHMNALMCRVFSSSLGDLELKWFDKLPTGLIHTFHQLTESFIAQFMINTKTTLFGLWVEDFGHPLCVCVCLARGIKVLSHIKCIKNMQKALVFENLFSSCHCCYFFFSFSFLLETQVLVWNLCKAVKTKKHYQAL